MADWAWRLQASARRATIPTLTSPAASLRALVAPRPSNHSLYGAASINCDTVELATMQCAAGGARNIVHPVLDFGCWITPTVLHQQIAEFCLEVQSWIFVEHFLNHLRWHLIKAKTQQLEPSAQVDQRDLGCHPRCDARRGVQGDRLPDQIGALRRHLMLGAELASSIRAVHFEAILAKVSRNQSEIVQNSAAKRCFLVYN